MRSIWFQSSDAVEDMNGDLVHSYLRRVPGSKYYVKCCLCDHFISIETKGIAAVNEHVKSKKHLKRRKEEKDNGNLGKYVEKRRVDCVIDAEIAIARFAAAHNLSLKTTVPHLVKVMKNSFPDSPICQELKSLSASRLALPWFERRSW